MNRWGPVALGDLSEIIMGQSPPADDIVDYPTGFPFYQGKADFGDLYPETTKYCIKAWKVAEQGDILITVRAPVGAVNLNASRAVIGRGIASVRPMSKKLHRDFLFQVLRSPSIASHWQRIQQGSTFDAINKDSLVSLNIPLPPLPVQRRIAEILGSVDAVMDSLRLSLDTLTRLEGQIIEHLLSRGINQSEYGTHPSIGSVPTHWSILPLKSVLLKAQYGLSLPLMASKPANGIPVLRMNNIRHGILDISNVKFLSHIDVTPDYILEDGDVLFNRTNSLDLVGKSACYHANLIFPLTFASYLIRLKPNSNAIIGNFLTLFLNSEKGQQQIRQIITPGVSQANISASNLMEILVPVPPVQEQTKIITFVHAIQKLKASYSAEKDRITSLKTALLSMLLTKHPAVEGVTHV